MLPIFTYARAYTARARVRHDMNFDLDSNLDLCNTQRDSCVSSSVMASDAPASSPFLVYESWFKEAEESSTSLSSAASARLSLNLF